MDRRRRIKAPRRRAQRTRYHGFGLDDSPRDRAVAELIDTYPGNLAEDIKDFLYRKINQEPVDRTEEILRAIEQLSSALSNGVPRGDTRTVKDDIGNIMDALARFET